MRNGMRYTLLILPAVLVVGWGSALRAQDLQATQPATQPAATVPPEMMQKAKTYKGSQVPPRQLVRQADGHWTPYTLPEKAPEGVEVYTIQQGDTLSGLAQQKLGNWLLWPQIWDQNPYIKDAHWIYPGDPLVMSKPSVVSEAAPLPPTEMQEVPPVAAPAPPSEEKMQIETESPTPPVNAYDVYCSGFITKSFKKPHLAILSAKRREKESLAQGDVVYLNEGKAEGLEPGMLFMALRVGQVVSHPVTGKEVGRMIQRIGQVKVLAVQNHTAIAEISKSCDEIRYGTVLVPWRPIPIPWDIEKAQSLPLTLEPSDKPVGRVIWTEDRLESIGQYNHFYMDLGSASQVLPGDKVWIFRYPAQQATFTEATKDLFRQQRINVGPRDLFRTPKVGKAKTETMTGEASGTAQAANPQAMEHEKEAKRGYKIPSGDDVKSIPDYIGEGVVITTEANTACVQVLSIDVEITLGDWVRVE